MITTTRSGRAALLATALLLPTAAHADKKEFQALTSQIATLQGQVAEAEQARVEAQKEVRRLAEMLTEQMALLRKLQSDLKLQEERATIALKDQADRLSDISNQLKSISPGGTSSTPGLVAPANPSSTPGSTLGYRELYQQAYSDFARKNYDLAIQGFQDYLRQHRETDLADNAQYWIGECLQAQSKYEDAVSAFNALLRDFPASDKIPDARYKKGVALEALGRRSQALLEYRFVVERFPNSPAARLARDKIGQQ